MNKKAQDVYLETLDKQLFDDLKNYFEIFKIAEKIKSGKTVTKISYTSDDYPEKPARIVLGLANTEIDIFSFYKESERKFIVDFWEKRKDESSKNHRNELARKTEVEVIRTVASVDLKKEKIKEVKEVKEVKEGGGEKKELLVEKEMLRENTEVSSLEENGEYRDFRYGAALIWDYRAIIPEIKEEINLESKTPEVYYPVKKFDVDKGEKETQLQLNVNLFRQKKWGLMNKSIELYQKKYGKDVYSDFNRYMQATALLKSSLEKRDLGPQRMAIAIYSDLVERTQDHDLKNGLLQYLIYMMLKQNDYIRSLNYAKKLFVEAKSNFEDELEEFASRVIIHSLSKLGQIEKVKEFAADKSIKVLLNTQLLSAYEIYTHLFMDKPKEAVEVFEKNRANFNRPILDSVLFNIGEAYFRLGHYRKSQEIFAQLVKEYSHKTFAAYARMRIALMADLLGDPPEKLMNEYKQVIDLAVDAKIKYEAKIRYVGVRLARKINITNEDRDYYAFLERGIDEDKVFDPPMRKLLWLVRLRTFINEKNYEDALTYIHSLPLIAMNPLEKRMFEGDGAEIVHGIMKKNFDNGEYGEVIRYWEKYYEMFFNKVVLSYNVGIIVGHAYIKMGLEQGLERMIVELKKNSERPKRSYPLWINASESNIKEIIEEIDAIKLIETNKWESLYSNNTKKLLDNPGQLKLHSYQGMAAYKLSKHEEAIRH
ncbi:MAG: tetratricopeptide repeat protein, partial [Oligoflexia bacterium]|nr:tetratricopeptide repeat protein [Oligoflexia bacterium]